MSSADLADAAHRDAGPGRAARWRARAGALGALAGAALAFVTPMLLGGSLPPGDDLPFALQLARTVSEGLSAGDPWPRWVDAMHLGLGAPALAIYPPVGAWLSGAAVWLTGDAITGLRLASAFGALLAGVGLRVAVRPWCGRAVSTLGGVVYVCMPYHFVDQYPRFAFAETLAFAFVPLVFRFTAEALLAHGRRRERAWLGLALSTAALLLTHSITAVLVAWSLPLFALVLLATHRPPRPAGAVAGLVAAGVLGAALAAFQLAPAWSERGSIRSEGILAVDHGAIDRNFLFLDETALGYTKSSIKPRVEAAAIPTALLALAAAAIALTRGRARPARDDTSDVLRAQADPDSSEVAGQSSPNHASNAHAAVARIEARALEWALAAVAVQAALMHVALSEPFWRHAPGAMLAQFPWRIGVVLAMAAVWLGVRALERPSPAPGRASPRTVFARGMLGFLVAWGVLVGFQIAMERTPPQGTAWIDERGLSGRIVPEYLPGGLRPDDVLAFAATHRRRVWAAPAEEIEVDAWSPGRRRFSGHFRVGSEIHVATFAHPSWRASLDGEPLALLPPVDESRHAVAILRVRVPPGPHEIGFDFARGASSRFGLGVTAAAGLACGALALRSRRARDHG